MTDKEIKQKVEGMLQGYSGADEIALKVIGLKDEKGEERMKEMLDLVQTVFLEGARYGRELFMSVHSRRA